MAAPQTYLYGLHEFIAENPDEVSFRVGETIIVIEKDDAYQDGWWQGTNEAGETGLFPYSYTTQDRDLAMNAKALALSAGGPQDDRSADSPTRGNAMTTTMADLDETLTELQGDVAKQRGQLAGLGGDFRRSFQSHRTSDTGADEDDDVDDSATDEGDKSEYQARGGTRAALAAKAKANAASEADRERAEQQRMKAQAQRLFKEEEERQRTMLLQKEAERKEAAAHGQLVDARSGKSKIAPIEGIDMSDESDSEGSADGLDSARSAPAQIAIQNRSGTHSSPEQSASAVQQMTVTDSRDGAVPQDNAKEELDDGLSSSPSTLDPAMAAASSPEDQGQSSNLCQAAAAAGEAIAAGAGMISAYTHRSNGNATHAVDQHSLNSSLTRPFGSPQDDSASIAPAAIAGGSGSPKSLSAPTASVLTVAPASASSVLSANRPSPPAGDPRDWSIDQVVGWARFKGWDETTVVSKFAEHEISGDVLIEMDVNILKEIDIVAFGKRFQVANAIKELRGLEPNGGAFAASSASHGAREVAGAEYGDDSRQPASVASAAAGASVIGLGVPVTYPDNFDTASAQQRRDISYDRGTLITHDASSNYDEDLNESLQREHSMIASTSADQRAFSRGAKSLSEQADEALISKRFAGTKTFEATTSPRRKEQGSRQPVYGERASFFSNFAPGRSRKAAPASPSAGNGGSVGGETTGSEDSRFSKGTFSKLGLNRLANRTSGGHSGSGAGSGDFKNQISLPTTSPTYDLTGDTARRNRASQMSSGSGNAGSAHGVTTFTQGQFAGATLQPSQADANGRGADSGPVISRIRPVDLEGWMHKKGEMYSSWKPRYLVLKGTDLVILRDSNAAKIKGYVSMKGYKVIGIADDSATARKYGFKILHETDKPHYFSSDDPILVRGWMKALMKATIGRDSNFPVISSYNNATISLKEAQRMNPPPRPPSPTSRARTQRARVRENLTELTAKDRAILCVSDGQRQEGGLTDPFCAYGPKTGTQSYHASHALPVNFTNIVCKSNTPLTYRKTSLSGDVGTDTAEATYQRPVRGKGMALRPRSDEDSDSTFSLTHNRDLQAVHAVSQTMVHSDASDGTSGVRLANVLRRREEPRPSDANICQQEDDEEMVDMPSQLPAPVVDDYIFAPHVTVVDPRRKSTPKTRKNKATDTWRRPATAEGSMSDSWAHSMRPAYSPRNRDDTNFERSCTVERIPAYGNAEAVPSAETTAFAELENMLESTGRQPDLPVHRWSDADHLGSDNSHVVSESVTSHSRPPRPLPELPEETDSLPLPVHPQTDSRSAETTDDERFWRRETLTMPTHCPALARQWKQQQLANLSWVTLANEDEATLRDRADHEREYYSEASSDAGFPEEFRLGSQLAPKYERVLGLAAGAAENGGAGKQYPSLRKRLPSIRNLQSSKHAQQNALRPQSNMSTSFARFSPSVKGNKPLKTLSSSSSRSDIDFSKSREEIQLPKLSTESQKGLTRATPRHRRSLRPTSLTIL